MDIIYLPFHDWKKNETEGLRNRDGHLVRELSKSPRVEKILFVDRPISLPERLLLRRPLRCRSGQLLDQEGRALLSRIDDNFFVLDYAAPGLIAPLRYRRDWWDLAVRDSDLHESIAWACSKIDIDSERYALISSSPLANGALGCLGERASLFDADDNWCNHPEMNDRRGWIRRGYETAIQKADALTCNSERTADFLESMGRRPEVIRNGVDLETWDPERWSQDEIPSDLAALPRPWIGYAGRLAKRTDVRLIADLARRRPEWSIVMLGPMLDESWHRPLRQLNNVYLLGDKHYDALPAYVSKFDVACIFHNVGESENDGDPIKLYEYLALGLPVVTTPIAGVNDFANSIAIEASAEGFEHAIEQALEAKKNNPAAFSKNRAAVEGETHSWAAKADRMLDLLESAMAK